MCKPEYSGEYRRCIRIAKDKRTTIKENNVGRPIEDHEKCEFGTAKGLQKIVNASVYAMRTDDPTSDATTD